MIERVRNKYRELRTYQDEGVVVSAMGDKVFRTLATRDERFMFEWVEDHPFAPFSKLFRSEYRVWSDGVHGKLEGGFLFEFLSGRTSDRSPRIALSGATGISFGAAPRIPRLMFPDRFGTALPRLDSADLRIDRVADFEGTACHVIVARGPNERRYELWVSTEDDLLRKVTTQRGSLLATTEIRRNIVLNAPITEPSFPEPSNATADKAEAPARSQCEPSWDVCRFDHPKTGSLSKACRKRLAALRPADISGCYVRVRPTNSWHSGLLEHTGEGYRWTNAARRSWTLRPDLARGRVLAPAAGGNPYATRSAGGDAFTLMLQAEPQEGQRPVFAFLFQGEVYRASDASEDPNCSGLSSAGGTPGSTDGARDDRCP